VGVHGNKKGIEELEIAAKGGHYLRPFAKILLALTALREKKPEVAREELAELVREFPRNALFDSELAKVEAAPGAAVRLP
jgi:predicted Zn-dependent protease